MSKYEGFGIAYIDNYDTSYMDEDIDDDEEVEEEEEDEDCEQQEMESYE